MAAEMLTEEQMALVSPEEKEKAETGKAMIAAFNRYYDQVKCGESKPSVVARSVYAETVLRFACVHPCPRARVSMSMPVLVREDAF